jgi:hypothetical protein
MKRSRGLSRRDSCGIISGPGPEFVEIHPPVMPRTLDCARLKELLSVTKLNRVLEAVESEERP